MTFKLELDRAWKEVEAEVQKKVREIALYTLSGVVKMSPVDTGRFRGNWSVSINRQDVSTYDTRGGQASMSRGMKAIGSYPKTLPDFYIQNNLPYAEALENGHSKQAPAGMVAVTLANVAAKYRNVIV